MLLESQNPSRTAAYSQNGPPAPKSTLPPASRVLKKHPSNPVLYPGKFPEGVMYVFNPGAIRFQDEYIIIADAATYAQPVVFWIARSKDGVHFAPDPAPLNWPPAHPDHAEDCVYDPRITKIGDEYIILYASSSETAGVRVGIVKTKDFKSFERVSIASEQGNRNGVLFPEKINGLYARLDRPFGNANDTCGVWISYSPDLIYWGHSRPVLNPRPGLWDGLKVGAGAVPIKTEQGWLEIYHGVTNTGAGLIYRLGVCLLDLEDPSRVIARGEDAILWPELPYEMVGRVGNVVFTCNALVDADRNVRIYYGAADTCIGLAEGKLDDLLDACHRRNPLLLHTTSL
ncbi:MAG: glycoside hydrolase family 130 protein [Chthoniobacteraceae bacterium]